MKTKFNKDSRNLLIAMLIGDGTISKNNVYKIARSYKQQDYLEWQIKQLNNAGIRNNGCKSYTCVAGYNKGSNVVYTQLNIIPFTKVLRRVFYKPIKQIANRKLLNRLDAKGIAIWYMDDGHINIRKTKDGRQTGFYIKISTCTTKHDTQILIDYFKEVWGISFYMFHEGHKEDSYSLCCGTKEGVKFINIVKPYVLQVPSMIYKITYDLNQRRRSLDVHSNVEIGNTRKCEDIV